MVVLLSEVGGELVPFLVGDIGGQLENFLPDRLFRFGERLLAG